MTLTIGILLFDDVEEMDFAGPYEVFGVACQQEPDWRLLTVAPRHGIVKGAKGLRIQPDHDFADCPELDLLLVPGGMGTRRLIGDEAMLSWLRDRAPRCCWLTSVCTGSLLLQAAGLLAGRRATTHWNALGLLRELGGTVVEDVRYIRDGNVVTAAGISAGIDMALWLTGQLATPDRARQVRKWMQYDPAPPYQAEV